MVFRKPGIPTMQMQSRKQGVTFLEAVEVDLLSRRGGGNVWESNPPRMVLAPDAGFEVREGHQSPSAPTVIETWRDAV